MFSEHQIEEMSKVTEHIKPHEMFDILGYPIYNTVLNTWLLMALLFALIYLATRSLNLKKPGKGQVAIEMLVEFLNDILDSTGMGQKGRQFLPLIGTFFVTILFFNFAWLLPIPFEWWKPPTNDLSTTAAFGVTAMILIHLIVVVKKGIKEYLHHYVSPSPGMLLLNIIEEVVKPVSLSLRLFGNIFGGELVVTILFIILPLFLPIPVQLLEVLMGLIQAFVFALLTATYIAIFMMGH